MKIILNGANGRMGREVQKLVSANENIEIVAKIDKFAEDSVCFTDIWDFNGLSDVIIDFSNHSGTEELMNYAVEHNTPVVVCTTGHTDDELKLIENASKETAVFHSANMSLGVALLIELANKTAAVMDNADIEIVETHHNRKLDAPSGTALMIAKELQKIRDKAVLKFGRYGQDKREDNEIGIHSIRRGNIPGIHEVIVSTDNETITLKHEAHSRALFAEGALKAAEFLCGKPKGLYNMNSIIGE